MQKRRGEISPLAPYSLSENSEESSFHSKGWMARRDERNIIQFVKV